MTFFHDQNLTLTIVPIDQLEEGRGLASRGYHSVALGHLERTGTASIMVTQPLTLHAGHAEADTEFIAWLREGMVNEANQHHQAKA